MIADNNVGDSDSSWEERTDEGPINPTEEAKRLGANLATAEKARKTRERKIQTNPDVKTAIKPTSSGIKWKKKINFSSTLKIK